MGKEYIMLTTGFSPDFGAFTEGDIRMLPVEIGDPLVSRGIAEEVI